MSNERVGQHILVAGAMGVGKTTVGGLLGAALGRPFLDSDEVLEQRTGSTGAEIAADEGVDALHERELEVFLDLVTSAEPSVIAPAASVVDTMAGRQAMAEHTTVHLVASEDVIAGRLDHGRHRRPTDARGRADLSSRREPYLREISAVTVDTGEKDPATTVAEILSVLPGL
jgi:shikimate kinase